jgi:hypothetical protein
MSNFRKWFAEPKMASKILELQRTNLGSNLNENDKVSEWFLTLSNSEDEISEFIKHNLVITITTWNDVVWYRIIIPAQRSTLMEFEKPLIETIKNLFYRWKKIDEYNYCILWQACVNKKYRWIWIPHQLKQIFQENFRSECELLIGEINKRNTRSVHVHIHKLWFEVVWTHQRNWEEWIVCALPTKNQNTLAVQTKISS